MNVVLLRELDLSFRLGYIVPRNLMVKIGAMEYIKSKLQGLIECESQGSSEMMRAGLKELGEIEVGATG